MGKLRVGNQPVFDLSTPQVFLSMFLLGICSTNTNISLQRHGLYKSAINFAENAYLRFIQVVKTTSVGKMVQFM